MILTVLCYNLQKMKKVAFAVLSIFCLSLLNYSCSMPKIVILNDPLSPEEHLKLGLSYEKKGLIDEAEKHYEEASKRDTRGFLMLGNLYFSQGDYKKAEEYYKKAISRQQNLTDALNNLAWLYYLESRNLDEAENLILKAIELVGDDDKRKIYFDTYDKIKSLKNK